MGQRVLMEHITDWSTQDIGRADTESRVEMLSCTVDEARWLIDHIPENDSIDELAQYLDQMQGDHVTDSERRPRYLILRIGTE